MHRRVVQKENLNVDQIGRDQQIRSKRSNQVKNIIVDTEDRSIKAKIK